MAERHRERLASFVSGDGTTIREIIEACQVGVIPMDVVCIIASKTGIGAIEKARRLEIRKQNIVIIDPRQFRNENNKLDQDAFGEAILNELHKRDVTVVTQNGWLPLTPKSVIDEYPDKIFNQHPGFVPEFGGPGMYGKKVHAATLYFMRELKKRGYEIPWEETVDESNYPVEGWTEVIAQHVAYGFDEGFVVKAKRVPIYPWDTVETLQERALPFEHRLQIELLKDISDGKDPAPIERVTFVKPDQEKLLTKAKEIAKLLYPPLLIH